MKQTSSDDGWTEPRSANGQFTERVAFTVSSVKSLTKFGEADQATKDGSRAGSVESVTGGSLDAPTVAQSNVTNADRSSTKTDVARPQRASYFLNEKIHRQYPVA